MGDDDCWRKGNRGIEDKSRKGIEGEIEDSRETDDKDVAKCVVPGIVELECRGTNGKCSMSEENSGRPGMYE